jgi:deazaflavin-dependent oxidoreductase (nitroreductase family)
MLVQEWKPVPPPGAEQIFDNPTDWVAQHIRRYVESNGEKGHRAYGHDSLLLITRGRRSGKLRRTALWYLRDGDRFLLVGSSNGSGRDPAWVHNVSANPAVVAQVRLTRSPRSRASRRRRSTRRCGSGSSRRSRSTLATRGAPDVSSGS